MDTHHEPSAGALPAARALLSITQDRHRDMTNLVRGLPGQGLRWVPADGASTLAGLTLHILDVERYLTALVTGEDIGWTGEIGTRIHETAAEHELVATIEARDEELREALAQLDADRWSSLAGDLLEDLDHVAVHLGQMQLTRNLYEAAHPEAAGAYQHWR